MCTSADTVVTTTNITAVSVSMRNAQLMSSSPEVIQRSITTRAVSCSKPTRQNTIHDSTHETISRLVVTSSEPRAPITRPNRPAMRQPMAGRKTMAE